MSVRKKMKSVLCFRMNSWEGVSYCGCGMCPWEIFEFRPEWRERIPHAKIWRKNFATGAEALRWEKSECVQGKERKSVWLERNQQDEEWVGTRSQRDLRACGSWLMKMARGWYILISFNPPNVSGKQGLQEPQGATLSWSILKLTAERWQTQLNSRTMWSKHLLAVWVWLCQVIILTFLFSLAFLVVLGESSLFFDGRTYATDLLLVYSA